MDFNHFFRQLNANSGCPSCSGTSYRCHRSKGHHSRSHSVWAPDWHIDVENFSWDLSSFRKIYPSKWYLLIIFMFLSTHIYIYQYGIPMVDIDIDIFRFHVHGHLSHLFSSITSWERTVSSSCQMIGGFNDCETYLPIGNIIPNRMENYMVRPSPWCLLVFLTLE